jgi:hypothetical protein
LPQTANGAKAAKNDRIKVPQINIIIRADNLNLNPSRRSF